ncbi:MAG: Ig-like domain-containing protein, partial [Ignavibacteriales bacterium]|nr:Ig-like domain-containing protein [Ignavibacteriales bacterium]
MKQTLLIRAAAIAGLIAVLSVSTRAGTPIRLSFRDTTIASGSVLAYPIYVDSSLSGYAVRSYQLEFTYNTSLFTFIGADSSGTVATGWGAPIFYEISPGRIRIAAAGTDTLAGKGKLVVLRLASKLFTGYTQYGSFYFEPSPTLTMMNQGSPTLDFRNGTVTISPAPSINISPNTALLTKGDVVQFSVSGGKSPYTWSTTSPSVASIDTLGKLTGLSGGLTMVVCKDSSGYVDTSGVVEVRTFKLSFHDTTRYQGQTLNLPVYCTDLSGLSVVSGKLDITFNSNLWAADTSVVQTGTLLAGYGQAAVAVGNGTISIAFAGGTTPLAGSGVLLYLKLRALTSSYGNSSIAVQSVLFNETMIGNGASSTLGVLRLSSITITPSSSQTLVAGDSLQFAASGGTPPYKWSVSDSQRVSISSAGWLKSTPKSSGKITVSVQDSIGGTGTSGLVTLYNFRVSIPDTTMIPATFVEVPVYATKTDTAFFSYQMSFSYSTNSYVKLVDVNMAGTLSSGMTRELSVDTVNRTANLAVIGVNAISSGGVLVKLKFAVSASAPASLVTSIAITGVMFNEGVPAALSKNGSFQ